MTLRFDDFELDTARYELRRHGELRRVEPMVFDLLVHFALHPDRVFRRDELIDAVWAGRVVSDATVASCIKQARRALDDSGDAQTYIKTVRGRGFRFTANVTESDRASPVRSATDASWTAGSDDPSLLILPLRALADTPELVRFVDALTGELSSILTRIPLLRLSARSGYYLDRPVTPTPREIHETLGVDYVLEGSVVQAWPDAGAERVRVTVHLADAKSGFRLWAETFTLVGPLREALDAGVLAIIAKLEPQLHRAIYHTVRSIDGEHSARQLYLEASGILVLQGWHHESFAIAADLLRRSWQREPGFALAAAYLSLVRGLGHRFELMGDRESARTEALDAAERALQLDSMDSTVLGFAGCALADTGYPDRGLPILRNAVELNPANAQAWAALGSAYLAGNRPDEAIVHLRHGIRISPLDSRLAIWGAVLATAHLLLGDRVAAREQAELACQRGDRCYMPRIVLAAIHRLDGKHDLARQAMGDAYRIKPDLSHEQVVALVGQKHGARLMAL
ncbi:winged helix-turn-helix domain-containing protein [Halomonas korlensis]|uniref:DNA-binding winged helix-turn-helix (WHTH) domain-containing protein n=1 Tax=Halomonas korlensis TaxID=463301 RepID=A0A1I7IY51_9GAMM|nr:winged helix-turn-helix domain-containing protein [Halomonas korlensis]SFU77751.1 DNA-binding winged helix-turn-helix (wHTH) domain-containing protein [Halomonas korlensis]